MVKRYRYRAYPTPGQATSLSQVFGCVRVVFNDFLTAREAAHQGQEPFETASALQSRLITQAKATAQRAWLSEVSATPLQQAVRDAELAYRNFFNSLSGKRHGAKLGKPRYKSRKDHRQTARFTRQCGFSIRQTTHQVGFVRNPKVGHLRFALSRPLPAAPSSVTVIREAVGRHYVSFVVQVAPAPGPEVHQVAGIDLGLADFAVITYGDGNREKVANPRHLLRSARKLAKAQRGLARKAKGSKNRDKARRAVAAAHREVRESRADFHHQIAAQLMRENQTIAVEQLKVAGLARSGARSAQGRGLRRSVHDAGWGSFLRVLQEKAVEPGRTVVSVNPAQTSQRCAVCGVLDGPKPLNVRVWECGGCGSVLDRDYNAAVNIMVAAGLAETLNAGGGDIRLELASADPGEARTHREQPVRERGLLVAVPCL